MYQANVVINVYEEGDRVNTPYGPATVVDDEINIKEEDLENVDTENGENVDIDTTNTKDYNIDSLLKSFVNVELDNKEEEDDEDILAFHRNQITPIE